MGFRYSEIEMLDDVSRLNAFYDLDCCPWMFDKKIIIKSNEHISTFEFYFGKLSTLMSFLILFLTGAMIHFINASHVFGLASA